MNNIILIGMPGSGKSTVGVVLAKVLRYDFIDSDLLIQKEESRCLHEIISDEGVEGFLTIENRVNSKITAEHSIIATGGSAIYGEEGMEHLKTLGTIVYLKLSYSTLKERLGDLKNRGVALKEGQTLKDLYEERVILYEKYAEITIDEEDLGIAATVDRIKAEWKKNRKVKAQKVES